MFDSWGRPYIHMSDSSYFQDEIQRDPDICSNCFRRLRGRYERNYRIDTYKGELEVLPVEGYTDDVYRDPDATVKIPERGGHRGMRTVCICGFRYQPNDEWKNRPLDKKTFFQHSERLLDRLEEKGTNFDRQRLLDVLDSKKSDPDNQFADDKIYQQAIEHVITVESYK